MRLLNAETLDFEEFFNEADLPQYAILSHTWDEDEVSLQDLQAGSAYTTKKGYEKIRRTCAIASEQGIKYAWVDTCCIDKTSSAELSEAINSMFQWYQDAHVCFAYLADVPPHASDAVFSRSRWFRRGWTLQELLAPKRIVFYASNWTAIDDRSRLAPLISSATQIDEHYLEAQAFQSRMGRLSNATIAEKMSWAARRQTTRTEDIAYCLLGIFGVNLPLIYGEGTKAFQRLQEEIIRRRFDPTILAWKVIQMHGDAQPPTKWTELRKFLTGAGHPWYQDRIEDTMPAFNFPKQFGNGILAQSPSSFHGCSNIRYMDVPYDYSITTRGISVTLPASDNDRPALVLPCYLRGHPRLLITITLGKLPSGLYSREDAAAMLVSRDCWRRWPRRQIVAAGTQHTVDVTRSSLLPEHRITWTFDMAADLRMVRIYPPNLWSTLNHEVEYPDALYGSSLERKCRRHSAFGVVIVESRVTRERMGLVLYGGLGRSLKREFAHSIIGIQPGQSSPMAMIERATKMASRLHQLQLGGGMIATTESTVDRAGFKTTVTIQVALRAQTALARLSMFASDLRCTMASAPRYVGHVNSKIEPIAVRVSNHFSPLSIGLSRQAEWIWAVTKIIVLVSTTVALNIILSTPPTPRASTQREHYHWLSDHTLLDLPNLAAMLMAAFNTRTLLLPAMSIFHPTTAPPLRSRPLGVSLLASAASLATCFLLAPHRWAHAAYLLGDCMLLLLSVLNRTRRQPSAGSVDWYTLLGSICIMIILDSFNR